MAQKETNILKRVMITVSNAGARCFRNNVGLFTTEDGEKVRTGLCKGSSDLIGWHSIVVTPDMVGRRVAVFTALEVKTEKGRASDEQLNFIEQVKRAGGIAGVVRSEGEALDLLA